MRHPIKPGLLFYFLPLLFLFMCQKDPDPPSNTDDLLIKIVDRTDTVLKKQYSIPHKQIQEMCLNSIQIENHLTRESETWTGIPLDSLISVITGIHSDDIGRTLISSADGFYSSLSDFHLRDGFPLAHYVYSEKKDSADVRPTKIFFPQLRRFYWVNDPSVLTITLKDTLSFPHQIRFDYIGQQSQKEWLRLKTLLRTHFSNAQFLRFLTSDGIFREYPIDGITRNYILIRKEDGTWELTGDNIHYGLELRQIFFITSDSHGLFMKIPSPEEEQTFLDVVYNPFLVPILSDEFTLYRKLPDGSTEPIEIQLPNGSFTPLFKDLFKRAEVDYMIFKRGE